MQRLTTLFLAVLLPSAVPAAAQTTFRLGARGGFNRALTTLAATSNLTNLPAYSYTSSKSATYTWQAGAVAEVSFGKISLQPALVFTQKGERFHTLAVQGDFLYSSTETTGTTHSNWLELPLNVVYTLHRDHGLQVFAGPYVALAVGGHQYGTANAQGSLIYAVPHDFDIPLAYGAGTTNRRLDVGLNAGLGYRQGPLQLQVGYGVGLRNVHQAELNPASLSYYSHNFNADAAYNRVVQLTGTYFLSL